MRDVDICGIQGAVQIRAVVPHGPGKRRIEMEVEAEAILILADCIRCCPDVYEDPATGQRPKSIQHALSDSRFKPTWIGHAVWHMEHPDRARPCPKGTP